MATQRKIDYRANFYAIQAYKGSVIDSVNRKNAVLDRTEKTLASLKGVKGLNLW
jgi:hypothetical protein